MKHDQLHYLIIITAVELFCHQTVISICFPIDSSCVEEDYDYFGADIIQVRHLTFHLLLIYRKLVEFDYSLFGNMSIKHILDIKD